MCLVDPSAYGKQGDTAGYFFLPYSRMLRADTREGPPQINRHQILTVKGSKGQHVCIGVKIGTLFEIKFKK
jgi:hypothetical protein